MRFKVKIAFFLLLISFGHNAQTTYLMSNANATITCASSNLFYDSGGLASNYSNNENFSKTFYAPAGSCLVVDFGAFNTQATNDVLRIYNGPNGASPLLGTYSGNLGTIGSFTASGWSITFSFVTNGSTVRPGWEATITCQAACTGPPPGGTITNVSSTCPSTGSVELSVLNSSQGCGVTYQWQSAPAAIGPWTNIAGAIFQTLTVPTGTTFYRRVTTCVNSVISGTSTAMASTTVITSACDLSTYTASAITYSFDTFGGTVLPTTDDVLFNSIVNFGFPFCYGGSQYWGGYVASNCAFVLDAVPCYPNIQSATYAAGGVSTGYSIGSAAPVNGTSIPRNAILAPWQDTDPSIGGTMRYATLGTAPNRRFVASWEGIPMYSCGTSSPAIYFTGQVKIYETTNNIEIHIGNKGLCTGWNGGYAIMGLHNFDGTVYRPPVNATAHNYPTNWTMTNTAYRFTSPCAGAGGPCVTLPINFKKFYGQQIDGINKLSWETAEETNLKEFIVERSTDAVNFTEIGKALPYNQPSKYDFNDLTFKPNIINYYKITAVENSGQRKSTFTLPIGGTYEDINVSEIYPNPVKDNFTLSFNAKIAIEADVIIKDMFGRTIKRSHHSVDVGNTRTINNCTELKAGIYIVEVVDSGNQKVLSQQKLIVVN